MLSERPQKKSGTPPSSDDWIDVRGARIHNLKNLTVRIPRDQLVVITGPSGSGKSSLAFDTIYAEGQRRYIESLSAYARQFLEQGGRPEVDSISGLSPTISIQQQTTGYNPRSTVGTVTEIYDYLRVLFARIGAPVCWKCGNAILSQTAEQIVDQVFSLPEESRIAILAPLVQGKKGEHQKELISLRQKGFVRALINGQIFDLAEDIVLDKNKKHDISVYIDRLILKSDRDQYRHRVSESVELALKMGDGTLLLQTLDGQGKPKDTTLYSQKFACASCNISYPAPEPRLFSFNSPRGACPACDGLGVLHQEDDQDKEGEESEEGPILKSAAVCPSCNGARLRVEATHFLIHHKNIHQLSSLPLNELYSYFTELKLNDRQTQIAARVLKDVSSRLAFLIEVGVGYLTLSRSAQSLSGGEGQRIRLATQIGSALTGVIYVLDEPSIGLHPKDHQKLLSSLVRLRDLGNSVLVVEHDQETIERADWVLDIGPGAGIHGGELIAEGTPLQIQNSSTSVTGAYLSGRRRILVPRARRIPNPERMIEIRGASENNLKRVDVDIPVGLFTCVTGVSGSGKSSLIIETLYRAMMNALYKSDVGTVRVESIKGLHQFDKLVEIDPRAIGRTPRSNPATYTGLFSIVRDLFSGLPESKLRGYGPGHFSFNVKGGRCEHCEGAGLTKIEMHFLPDVYVLCESCRGKRYNRDVLDIRYKGKNISEVLGMSVETALDFFSAVPLIKARLKLLFDVGLGYIQVGQSATTLSGGESQRIKIARELAKRDTGKTLYILDEPSTGLHFEDVQKLIEVLNALVHQGSTVIVIEHHMDIIKSADYVIDIGPDGGVEGGRLVASGSPEKVALCKESHTGQFLKALLGAPGVNHQSAAPAQKRRH